MWSSSSFIARAKSEIGNAFNFAVTDFWMSSIEAYWSPFSSNFNFGKVKCEGGLNLANMEDESTVPLLFWLKLLDDRCSLQMHIIKEKKEFPIPPYFWPHTGNMLTQTVQNLNVKRGIHCFDYYSYIKTFEKMSVRVRTEEAWCPTLSSILQLVSAFNGYFRSIFLFRYSLVSHVWVYECPELSSLEFQKNHRYILWNQFASEENRRLGGHFVTLCCRLDIFRTHNYCHMNHDIIQQFIALLECDMHDGIFWQDSAPALSKKYLRVF